MSSLYFILLAFLIEISLNQSLIANIIKLDTYSTNIRQVFRKTSQEILVFASNSVYSFNNAGIITPVTGDLISAGMNDSSIILYEDSSNILIVGCGKNNLVEFFSSNNLLDYKIPGLSHHTFRLSSIIEVDTSFYLIYSESLNDCYYEKFEYISGKYESKIKKDLSYNSFERCFCNVFEDYKDDLFCLWEENDSPSKIVSFFSTGGTTNSLPYLPDFKMLKSGKNIIIFAMDNNILRAYTITANKIAPDPSPTINASSLQIIFTVDVSEIYKDFSVAIIDENSLIYCLITEKKVSIAKLQTIDFQLLEAMIQIESKGDSKLLKSSLEIFKTSLDFSIIVSRDDNTNWILIISATANLCLNKNDYCIAKSDSFDMTLLSDFNNNGDSLLIIFATINSDNIAIPSPLIDIGIEYPLSDRFAFSTSGDYSYTYKIISNGFIMESEVCSFTLTVCIANCQTCNIITDRTNPICTACKPGYALNQQKCLPECSPFYYYLDTLGDYQCMIIESFCDNSYPFLINGTNQCITKCPLGKICTQLCPTPCTVPLQLSIQNCLCLSIIQLKEEKKALIDDLTYIVRLSEELSIINKDNSTYEIYKSPRDDNNPFEKPLNISSILPSELIKLREQSYISFQEEIIIYKKDTYNETGLVNHVELKFFSKDGIEIQLSTFDTLNIDIIVPIIKTESPFYKLINSMGNKGINITDPNDSFFNEFCFKYNTANNTDLTQKDRVKHYLANNSTLCPNGFEFKGIDYKKNTSICSFRSVPVAKKNTFEEFKNSLVNAFIDANWKVVTCIKSVTNMKILSRNIGNWFIIIISLLSIANIIWFYRSFPFTFLRNYLYRKRLSNQNKTKTHHSYKKIQNKNSKTPKMNCHHLAQANAPVTVNNEQPKTYTDDDFDEMDFKDLIENDKRSILKHYWGFLRNIQPFIFAFFIKSPKTFTSIKVSLFLMGISIDFALSAFFYSDKYISSNYTGESNFFTDLPVSAYSSCLGALLGIFFNLLTSIEGRMGKIEKENDALKKQESIKQFIKLSKIKLNVYMAIKVIVLAGLWYYTTSFCAVYRNSQLEWLISGIISLGISQLIPFVLALILTFILESCLRRKSICWFKVLRAIRIFI